MPEVSKKKKPSLLLYLLAGTVALILLIGIVLFFLLAGSSSSSESDVDFLNSTVDPETTTDDSLLTSLYTTPTVLLPTTVPGRPTAPVIWEYTTTTSAASTSTVTETTTESDQTTNAEVQTTIETSSSESETSSSEEQLTTVEETTTSGNILNTTMGEEVALPLDASTLMQDRKENNDKVASCSAYSAAETSCPRTSQDIKTVDFSTVSSLGHLSHFHPIHYNLSVLVRSILPPMLEGTVQIYVEAVKQGNQIVLNAGRSLRNINSVSVVGCSNGRSICVSKFVHDTNDAVLYIILSEEVESGEMLRVEVNKFGATDVNSFFTQLPPRWDRKAPELLGTQMLMRNARNVFPCYDHPVFKASLTLCVSHSTAHSARSNSDVTSTTTVPTGTQTCFETTVPMAAHQYAFTVFQNAQTKVHNASTVHGAYVPLVEIVFSQGERFFQRVNNMNWIYEEASKVFAQMSAWTSLQYPLPKMTIVSAPLPMLQTTSGGPGLIVLQDRIIEYPTYIASHVTLIREIIRQWIGGFVSVKDWKEACVQESLVVYLETKLNEELHIVNKTRALSLDDLDKARPQDLMRERQLAVQKEYKSTAEIQQTCSDRMASIYYSIDETYGRDAVIGMVKNLVHSHTFGHATIEDYAEALEKQTRSPVAGNMLRQWFTEPARPVLSVKVTSTEVQLFQLTETHWQLPLEIGGSSGVHRVDIKEGNQSIPYTSTDYVILDPKRKSVAFVGYDIETYLRLIRCWDDSRCPSNKQQLKGIFEDFGAMLIANLIKDPTPSNIPRWVTVVRFARQHDLLKGDVLCCAKRLLKEPEDPKCFFVVNDKCSKIEVLK